MKEYIINLTKEDVDQLKGIITDGETGIGSRVLIINILNQIVIQDLIKK